MKEILNEKYEIKSFALKNHYKRYFVESIIDSISKKKNCIKKVLICSKSKTNIFGYVLDSDIEDLWKIFYLMENEKLTITHDEKDQLILKYRFNSKSVDFEMFLLNDRQLSFINKEENTVNESQVRKIRRNIKPLKKNNDFYFEEMKSIKK